MVFSEQKKLFVVSSEEIEISMTFNTSFIPIKWENFKKFEQFLEDLDITKRKKQLKDAIGTCVTKKKDLPIFKVLKHYFEKHDVKFV